MLGFSYPFVRREFIGRVGKIAHRKDKNISNSQ